ncbi:MAG: hypothetical protein ACR5LF_12480 [Symbiopectobacterium sp.]
MEESRVGITAQGDPAVSVDLNAGQQVSPTQYALLDDVAEAAGCTTNCCLKMCP